jgi:hypothetical protein
MVDFHNVGRDPRFLAAGDVKYLVLAQPVNDPALREVFRGQGGLVYENTQVPGRAWLVGRAARTPAEGTLAAMQAPGWDPRATAVVESPRDLALGGPGVRGTAAVTRYQPDHVEVRTDANGAALLVLADNFYPGWKAAVDGRPAEIYRTNHTFRGVVVPAGRHRVSFSFEPAALYTGFYIYLATLALLGAYGIWLLVASRRHRGDARVDAARGPAPA